MNIQKERVDRIRRDLEAGANLCRSDARALLDYIDAQEHALANEKCASALAAGVAEDLARECAALTAKQAWQPGVPTVAVGSMRRFWCAISYQDTIVCRLLMYCNRHLMPVSDCCEPDADAVPVGDDGDYEWTGWFEPSCEQCDTQWRFSGEVVGWMELPQVGALARTAAAYHAMQAGQKADAVLKALGIPATKGRGKA